MDIIEFVDNKTVRCCCCLSGKMTEKLRCLVDFRHLVIRWPPIPWLGLSEGAPLDKATRVSWLLQIPTRSLKLFCTDGSLQYRWVLGLKSVFGVHVFVPQLLETV